MSTGGEIVVQTVRQADPDRYLSALYAPEDKRASLFALYAFDAEVTAIRDRIREPLPGEIRLQWWHEVIDAGSERAADGHPVAEALLEAITRHALPHAAFSAYLEARMFDLFDDPMPSRGDLEGYLGETSSAIMQMAAIVLDPAEASSHADLAGHAGCAIGIARLLRLLPVHRARGQCFVPTDILAAAGTTAEDFVAGRDTNSAGRAVAAMSALAEEHLLKARARAMALPPNLRPAFLHLALVPAYLKRVSRAAETVNRRPIDISPLRRHWLLFRAASKGL